MAAANPGRVARQSRAALLRYAAPRRAAGAGAGGTNGRVLAGPRPEPGGRVQHAEPAGRPSGTGGAAGRCPRPVVPGLSGGYYPASSRGADVPRSGAAHGPECGQRQEPLGPRPGPVATFAGSFRMSTTIDVPGGAGALPVTVPKVAAPAADDPRLVRALEDYSAALRAGRRPDRHEFQARYPEIAEALAECLEGLEFLQAAAPHLQAPGEARGTVPATAGAELCPEGPLGDYRLVREVGRGGMGIVYEAVQISLGRRVALKVLPFAATLDPKQLQRFKNEAQAAAQLHHTNIVPVFGTGQERGVHYYAMQFIDGQTLAAVISARRRATPPDRRDPSADAEATGPYGSTAPVAALSTGPSAADPAFVRAAARLGIQAALALEHAHQVGIIHRDIKPSNLLVETPAHASPLQRGDAPGEGLRLWVTDFGLAHCQSQAGLTMTGDLVGTLRYMSPEQALAQRVVIDQRTDIYSLGATLYELLTLEPAFTGRDRQELLRQIAFEEPCRPRHRNRAIPPELETIVLKALEKNPVDRYATAQELADDLQRYLHDEPIRAKRPSLVQRVRKWARRHRPVVFSAVAATAVVVAIAIVALLISLRNISAALTEKSAALEGERQANEELARTSYFRSMALAERHLSRGNVGGAEELLNECPPKLRGWEWHYLKRQRYGKAAPLQHPETSFFATFSPDGRQIASNCLDGIVRVWDAETGTERDVFPGERAGARGLAWSPDGRYLAAARANGVVSVWNAVSEKAFALQAHPKVVWHVAFSPDSRTLASAGSDGKVRLWNVAGGQGTPADRPIHTLAEHPAEVRAVAFSADGRHLLSACDDGTVKTWNVATEQETFSFRGQFENGWCPSFSPDARRLAWACQDGVVKIWDMTTGRLEIDQQSNTVQCRGVAFSPDGSRIALAGFDSTLRLWDAGTGREMLTIYAHPSPVSGVAFSPDPDGFRLASASYDHTVRIWDATPLTRDPQAGHCVTLTAHQQQVSGVAFSRDGRWLASASVDDTVKVWQVVDVGPASRAGPDPQVPLGSRHLPALGKITLRYTLRGHRANVIAVAFSSDNRTLASASWDNTVKLWDLGVPEGDSLAELRSIPFHQR